MSNDETTQPTPAPTERPADSPAARRWGVALAVYWLTLFAATHLPTPQLVAGAMELNADKLIHATAYFVLATLILRTARAHGWRRVGLLTLNVAVGYAALDELTQPYVGRICDALDFAADAAGVLMAVGFDRWRRSRSGADAGLA